jgi:hypothetical protein
MTVLATKIAPNSSIKFPWSTKVTKSSDHSWLLDPGKINQKTCGIWRRKLLKESRSSEETPLHVAGREGNENIFWQTNLLKHFLVLKFWLVHSRVFFVVNFAVSFQQNNRIIWPSWRFRFCNFAMKSLETIDGFWKWSGIVHLLNSTSSFVIRGIPSEFIVLITQSAWHYIENHFKNFLQLIFIRNFQSSPSWSWANNAPDFLSQTATMSVWFVRSLCSRKLGPLWSACLMKIFSIEVSSKDLMSYITWFL